MTLRSWAAVSVGVGLAALLLAQAGISSVGDAVAAAGWAGVLAATLLHVAAQLACAVAMWALVPPVPGGAAPEPGARRPACARLMAIRLVRDAVGEVMPAVPLGELAAVRELMRAGLDVVEAAALTIADLTIELAGQAGFSVVTFVLAVLAGLDAWRLLGLSGLAGSVLILAGCAWVQWSGGRAMARLCGGAVPLLRTVPHAWGRLQAALGLFYGHRGRVALASAIHLAAWFVGGLQSLVVLRLMGVPVTPAGALVLEAFMSSVRRVAPTPGAIGVQEGGYVLAGSALGIDDGASLALSLVKRARDLLVALPVILAWQAIQLRRARGLARAGGAP